MRIENNFVNDMLKLGACGNISDPDIFHPIGNPSREDLQVKEPLAICASCPIRSECLGYGMKEKLSGIWGGTLLERGQDVWLPKPGKKLSGLPRKIMSAEERRAQIIALGPQRT